MQSITDFSIYKKDYKYIETIQNNLQISEISQSKQNT